jgi:hypothetical protein
MLTELTDKIHCEICDGNLKLNIEETMNDYAIAISLDITSVFDKIDAIIGKYLIFECVSCRAKYKYRYKDLERVLRKSITQKMLALELHNNVMDNNALHDKLFFYCGKCNGYDGAGSCPKSIYNKCEIKRFPLNEL